MPSAAGPIASAKQNLVFTLDSHDMPNGATPLGCGGFNGSTQGIKDLISGTLYTFENGMKLTNRTYYTAFGISYPEGSYGADAAGVNGLYLGYNVRGGTNVYGASRSLHLWVWNNQTNSWISGYFNGARIGGHCYDNYIGAENGWQNEMAKFVADYNTVKNLFPDCTYIIVGSHACQCFRQEDIDTLISLGAPSYIQDWMDNASWREFVLVGKPGLGVGNAYGWAHENYPTNPVQVAHLNFGLPIKARGAMEFDGSNDYITVSNPSNYSLGTSNFSLEFVFNKAASGGSNGMLVENRGDNLVGMFLYVNMSSANTVLALNHNSSQQWTTFGNYGAYQPNTNYHLVVTVDRSAQQASHYVNGNLVQVASITHNNTITDTGGHRYNIGQDLGGSPYYGNISVHKLYNKTLTATEVQQNYQQYKTRFNLS